MCEQFVVGQTHSFSIGLRDSTNQWIAKANPTLDTTNDFLISINDGAWDTLDNAPSVSPAGSEFVDVTFSIAETTAAGVGGDIKLRVADADEASGWIGGVWRYNGVVAAPSTLTGTAAAQTSPVVGSTLNITRAATYSATLTGLTVPSGWTSARWTVKRSSQKASTDGSTALIQILVSATPNAATDGLVVLNSTTSGLTLTDASLLISGTTATITIADHVTAQLAKDNYEYDIKFYHGDSESTVVTEAVCNIVATPTQTV